jgi:undecaprenyl-diphosphatase
MTPTELLSDLFLGLLQGLTEFLPISSSGHLAAAQILLPGLRSPGVSMELATHVGTTIAVMIYYRHLLAALLLPGRDHDEALLGMSRERWLYLLAVGTLPTVIIGFALRSSTRAAFDDPLWVAAGWILSGCVLMASLLAPAPRRPLGGLSALLVGAVQGLAIFPGVTRSGTTITAGMLLGVPVRAAVTYSFFLSIPAILGAALLDAVQMMAQDVPATLLFQDLLFASLAAGFIGYFCIGMVHRATAGGWWHRFAWYCWLAALVLVTAAR